MEQFVSCNLSSYFLHVCNTLNFPSLQYIPISNVSGFFVFDTES